MCLHDVFVDWECFKLGLKFMRYLSIWQEARMFLSNLGQGNFSAADYAIEFRTLAAQKG